MNINVYLFLVSSLLTPLVVKLRNQDIDRKDSNNISIPRWSPDHEVI
jgi:hypothetical protein